MSPELPLLIRSGLLVGLVTAVGEVVAFECDVAFALMLVDFTNEQLYLSFPTTVN